MKTSKPFDASQYTAYTEINCDYAFLFSVTSTRGEQYDVNLLANTCTCEAFVYGKHQPCKHLTHIAEIVAAQIAFDTAKGTPDHLMQVSHLNTQLEKCYRANLLPRPQVTETPAQSPLTLTAEQARTEAGNTRFEIYGRLSRTRRWERCSGGHLTQDKAEKARVAVWAGSGRYSETEVRAVTVGAWKVAA